MTRAEFIPRVGLSLVAAVFVAAVVRVGTRDRSQSAAGVVTIRFAHWQLESGLRSAYDALAARYTELHPNVRVEQMAIPESVYGTWLRTQVVGGTAPDLVEFGHVPTGVGDELLARNFVPLTADLERPNPYNAGTRLAGVPWRETFLDGLDGVYRSSNLQDYYKVPMSLFTVRIYYNRALWRSVLGDTPEPKTFAELEAVTHRVEAFAAKSGRVLIPIAGSANSYQPVDQLFGSQTQRLSLQLDTDHDCFTTAPEIALGALRGEWDMDSPALGHGLGLVHSLFRMMPAGFMQLTRSDATFLFLQQRAVMISTGSWDATSLTSQVPFEVAVFRLPLPALNDKVYGPAMLGSDTSEADLRPEGAFSLWRGSPHAAVALDFLRFITSQAGSQLFVQKSHWLPAIIGVEPDPSFRAFMPHLDGVPNGFDAKLGNIGPEVRRVWESTEHLLGGQDSDDSVAAFRAAYRSQFRTALISDLTRWVRVARANSVQQDTTMAAWRQLAERGPDAENAQRKFSDLFAQQNRQEAEAAWIADELTQTQAPRPSPSDHKQQPQ